MGCAHESTYSSAYGTDAASMCSEPVGMGLLLYKLDCLTQAMVQVELAKHALARWQGEPCGVIAYTTAKWSSQTCYTLVIQV
jgi:hypothetical protein